MVVNPNDNIDTSEFFEPEETMRISSDFTDITPIINAQSAQPNRMFTVYRAQRYGQWWALKCVSKDAVNKSLAVEILRKEFEVGISLWHPNIARMISKRMDLVDGCPGIVQEYVDGIPLRDYLSYHPPVENRIRIAEQIISAMEYYMGKQVVHCDLKSTNILITRNGHHVKIVDFGLSNRDAYNVIRGHGGTDVWAAPEQLDTNGVVDCRSDFYAFGHILKLLKLPRRFNRIIRRCLKPQKEDRYSNAMELRLDFEKSKTTMLPRWAIGFAAACLALIVGAFVLGNWTSQNIVRTISTPRDRIVEGQVPALYFGDSVKVHSNCDETYVVSSAATIYYLANSKPIPGPIPATQAVDLGLSVDWAPFNVGCDWFYASNVGGYYNWADSTGHSIEYSTEKYPVKKQTASIAGSSLDIASQYWKHGWRIPTKREMEELINQCKWSLVEQRGMVKGYIVTGPSGKCIFLPFGGWRVAGIYKQQGLFGLYWSATPNEKSNETAAYYLWIKEDVVSADQAERAVHGLNIRPVHDK
ncbi:MAG: protein kinase [Sodaliphilus sp.]